MNGSLTAALTGTSSVSFLTLESKMWSKRSIICTKLKNPFTSTNIKVKDLNGWIVMMWTPLLYRISGSLVIQRIFWWSFAILLRYPGMAIN